MLWLERLTLISTEEDKMNFRKEINKAGFVGFNQLINNITDKIKEMNESEFKMVKGWLELFKEILPYPGEISPAWQNIWKELDFIFNKKVELFSQVDKSAREGEWQVIFDNPFSTDETVCNQNKTFEEATFLMAKYSSHIKEAEYVKLQRVDTFILERGLKKG